MEWQIQMYLNIEANNLRAITENTVCLENSFKNTKPTLYFANHGVFHNIIKKNGMYVVES